MTQESTIKQRGLEEPTPREHRSKAKKQHDRFNRAAEKKGA